MCCLNFCRDHQITNLLCSKYIFTNYVDPSENLIVYTLHSTIIRTHKQVTGARVIEHIELCNVVKKTGYFQCPSQTTSYIGRYRAPSNCFDCLSLNTLHEKYYTSNVNPKKN